MVGVELEMASKNYRESNPSTGSEHTMLTNRDLNWLANYNALKAYINEHHHLPDKHRVEFRGLLNWAKYQRKRIKDASTGRCAVGARRKHSI